MRPFLCIILIITAITAAAQSEYVLPNDPITVRSVPEYNWLKKIGEEGLNKGIDLDNVYGNTYFLKKYIGALDYIGRNEVLMNTLFAWARPYVKRKISEFDVLDKIKMYNLINQCLVYLQTFDAQREERYLLSDESMFSQRNSKEFFDEEWFYPYPYELVSENRGFEAFFFRRIRNGVDRNIIIKLLKEVQSYIDVNFSGMVNIQNTNTGVVYEFFWNKAHFDGAYTELATAEYSGIGQPWVSVSGKYKNGQKHGVWKHYTARNKKVVLDYEIEYSLGKPLKLSKYATEVIKNSIGEDETYNIDLKLDVSKRILEATVYFKNKIYLTYSSLSDNIDYWDMFETQRRIEQKLSKPGFEIVTGKRITNLDKPTVPRSKETNNYILYDRLARKGKDHALLIATDEYDSDDMDNLKNPVRDAEAIANNLTDIFGFNCEIIRNPTKAQLLAVLARYQKRKFATDEQLFIYITGHGSYEPSTRDGYIIPKDGQDRYSDASHRSWISYGELNEYINEIKSHHILLAIDACYSGSFERALSKTKNDSLDRKISDPELWFRARIRFKTKIYVTSTSADRSASDGINHSPFASMFILGLQSYRTKKGYIVTISDIYTYLDAILPSPIKNNFPDNDPESSFFFIMK